MACHDHSERNPFCTEQTTPAKPQPRSKRLKPQRHRLCIRVTIHYSGLWLLSVRELLGNAKNPFSSTISKGFDGASDLIGSGGCCGHQAATVIHGSSASRLLCWDQGFCNTESTLASRSIV